MEKQGRSDSPASTGSGETVPLEVIPLHSTNLLTVVDEDGIIQYESPSIERIYGYSPEDLVGEQVAEYFHPADRENVLEAFDTVVSSDEYAVEAVEYRHEQADGTYRWVESTASTNPTPDGRYVINTRDISDRKERDEQLERFRQALEATAHAVFITDTEGRIEYVNEAFTDVTGYGTAEAIGQTPRILKSGEMDEAYYAELWETILSGEVWSEEIVNRRKSGELYHAAQTISPITNDDEVAAFVAVQADVTDQRERETEIRRQNERLDQFAKIVSHDLRNPLNIASLRVDLARETGDSDHLDDVVKAHERMETLIEDLLALARDGETVTVTEPVDLEVLAETCWQTVPTGDATLVTGVERPVNADETRTRQLLENLVRNAVEHGGNDVTIRIGELDDRCGFYVADDGTGITADVREHAFETGYSTGADGTGLGLTIVRGIAEAHGWDIRLADSREGGLRVEITGVEFV